MEHTYVSVGEYVAKQKCGLPIGGIVSAPMASIDSMYKEFSNKKLWTNRGYAVKCRRFRDDIRVLVGARLNDEGITNIVDDFQKMYGDTLKVELENVSYGKGKFLNISYVVDDGKLVTYDNNKSFMKFKKEGEFKVRFLEVISGWDRKMFIAVMYSQILGLIRKTTAVMMGRF